MKIGWTIIYIMGSVWIAGMLMQITGVPFGKDGFARAVAPQAGLAVAAPPAVALPVAPAG